MQDVRIVFLGTSAGMPSRERNVAAVAVVLDGSVLLFDCGEGTQHQFLRAPVRSGSIDAIFLTHLHGDHVYGLPGLLATMSMNGRSRPLDLIGPEGTREYLEATLETSNHNPIFPIRIRVIPIRIRVIPSAVEGSPDRAEGRGSLDCARDDTRTYRGDGFLVEALPLQHSVPCLGYCVIEDDRPGEFDPARARALGIPEGPQWGELQRARDPRVTGPVRHGRRIVYCTDTLPCEAAVELARDSDVLIHEATYTEEMALEAQERFHSTAAGAARVARDANAKKLILTHFSTRYRDADALVEEAKAIFPNVEAASDLAEFGVPPR